MEEFEPKTMEISNYSDISSARNYAKIIAIEIGFDGQESEEIALVVSELASNLVKYADRGLLKFKMIKNNANVGIQIESIDEGPGIENMEIAIADGFSKTNSLGYGLGTVNRLMDEFDITSNYDSGNGTYIICKSWKKVVSHITEPCPFEFGVATRPYPGMRINGDAFIIKKWNESALVGVIDGLGHGQYANRATTKARQYIEDHFALPLSEIFRGVARNCYATRGVVMALVRFDWKYEKMTFANVGNIEARVFNSPEPINFIVRRGIIGVNAPNPMVSEYQWFPKNIMILHSDGLKTHWKWSDFSYLYNKSATNIAQELLRTLARDTDDATVVVVKENTN
jgi:anti-sigma regulatory factor (Ser/Thr protein kinase)